MLDFIKAGQNLPYFIVRDIQRWRKAQPSDSTASPMDFLGLHLPGIKMEGDSLRPIQDLRLNDLILVAVGSSGILKGKQKLGGIDFTKFSKMTMCRASEANS